MKKSIFLEFLGQMNEKVFLFIMLVYHVIFMFQGLDFVDEGFHATFYQQIFTHPESHVMNFMYWFTGIVGGTFYYMFPGLGLLGLRIQGILVVYSTMLMAYFLLRKYIEVGNLRLGIILLIIFTTNDIKEMQYDTLSAFLNLGSAICLFYGLINSKKWHVFAGGTLISLSMFTRIPSISMLIFVLAIIYYSYFYKRRIIETFSQIAIFIGGFIAMTIGVLIIMKLIGHLPYYIENLKIGFGWVESSADSHSLYRLIKMFISDYSRSMIYGLLIFLTLFGLIIGDNIRTKSNKERSVIPAYLVGMILISIVVFSLFSQKLTHSKAVSIFTGISFIATFLALINRNYRIELKLLLVLGCLIILFAPFGSAGGLSGGGRHSLWILLPVSIDYLFRIRSLKGEINIFSDNPDQSLKFSITDHYIKTIKTYFILISLTICIYFSYYYPYFDVSERTTMFTSVDNKLAAGILTTKERAEVIDELLHESSKYIKKDDFVLAYDCIPMFHFLTETRPYMPNTWPWLYMSGYLKKELENSRKIIKELPVIVLQKRSTLNSNWPLNTYGRHQKALEDRSRDSIMNVFMIQNNYIKSWENDFFEIHQSPKAN